MALLIAGMSAEKAHAAVIGLSVYPSEVHLSAAGKGQQVIVVATHDDGVTQDVTATAKLQMADAHTVRLAGHSLFGVVKGFTTLDARYAGQAAQARVVVTGDGTQPPVSFRLDVMPVLLRAGCNAGSCHGSAHGKDGFRLSLFGYDPAGDYYRLTREMPGRRINLALPEESLLMRKAIGSVPHTGGKRFASDSIYHETLSRWLTAGAPDDPPQVPTVRHVELFPPEALLLGRGAQQQFIVRAKYSDDSERDVTNLAVFLTNNDNTASVSPDGLVTAGARGEAFITARFDTTTVGSQVLVLPEGLHYSPSPITGNYIDQLIGAKLQKTRELPSELCTDEEFLRRVTIDITGRLPTAGEFNDLLADASQDKRSRTIDRLLARKDFAEIWAMKWASLLMIRSGNEESYKSAYLYSTWLTDQISNNVPLDAMVRTLLTASGGTFRNPPANFYEIERDTLKTSENVAQTFLGIRIQCAQCHNHPFDRWTMNDYYSFAAFFSQVGRKQSEDYREKIVFNRGDGEVRHKVDNRVMAPKFLGGDVPDLAGRDRREVLAEWLTSPSNPYFAPSVANRVWDHFFGRGIVEPVDDIRVSNPPTNPELFRTLGRKLVEYKYDFKRLVRDICNSQAYQRSVHATPSNAHDAANFARANVRRIPAEMLLDCISQVTETQDKFYGLPLGARAVEIADGRTTNYFLTTFGRSPRATVCACEARDNPTLSQALHLLNGDTVPQKIRQGGVIHRLLAEKKSPREVIESLYVRCLSRKPTDEEREKLLAIVATAKNPEEGLSDVFWATLNSREFLFNH